MAGKAFTQQSIIKTLMKSLDDSRVGGKEALDVAIRDASHGRFKSTEDLIRWFNYDCETYSASGSDYTARERKKAFLQEYCGINLSNEDTGAITGFDAEGSTEQKTAHSIVPDTNDGNLNGHTIAGLSFDYPGYSRDIAKYRAYQDEFGNRPYAQYTDQMIEKMQYIVGGIHFHWARNALELIEKSYGMSLTELGSLVDRIHFNFTYKNNNTLGTTRGVYQKDRSINVTINLYHYLNASGEDGKDPATGSSLDRLLAHELVHGVMFANIKDVHNLPHFLHEGVAELVHGADDLRFYDILKIIDKNNLSDRDKAFALMPKEYNDECYEGGYTLMRYFAKQSAEYERLKSDSSWNSANKRVVLDSSFTGTYDFRRLSAAVKQVDASHVASYVYLWANDDQGQVFWAGSGGTWFNSGNKNDVFYGGAGVDTICFHSNDGEDTVDNFEAGKDVLYFFDNSNWQKTGVNGSDVTLQHGAGKITLKNGALKKILIKNSRDEILNYWFGRDDHDNAYEYEADGYYIGSTTRKDTIIVRQNGANVDSRSGRFSSIDLVDASRTTGGVTVTRMRSAVGGAGNDTLIAPDGGGSVLRGGGGNDRLYLGKSVDRVYFGSDDGNDYIEGFEANKDRLVLYDNGKVEKVRAAKGELVLRDGRGTVTLKDGAGKKLLIEDGKGKVHRYWFGWDDRDNAYEYEANGNYRGSAQRKDTLVVRSTASINLREPNFRDIDVLDARTSSGPVRISGARFSYGGRGNDTISAAVSSESILDGGAGSDTLTGSSGRDVFRFGMGYGKDRIVGSDKKDLLHLIDITDVNKLAVSAANGVLSLNIRGTDDTVSLSGWSANSLQTVRLANGREYHFARANNGRMTLV